MILRAVERGGGGMPLVLLHGLFGRAANFSSVQQRLAERRRVIALDLRNHGGSPHDPQMDYDLMAEDVAATVRSMDASPCALVGHSLGGKVAMRLALTDPSVVGRLLVADIAPVRYPPHFRRYAAAMLAMPLVPGMSRAAADAALAPAIQDRAVRAFLLQNFRPGPDPGWTCGLREIADALPAIEDFPGGGSPYLGPTLVLSGARSDYVRPEHRLAFYELFPRARFASLRNAGHWLHVDDPEGFVMAADAFAGRAVTSASTPTA